MNEVPHSTASFITGDAEARAVVERLAAEFRADARQRDQSRSLPAAQIEQLTQAGFFGMSVPRVHGGAEVSAATVAHCFRVLAAADPSIAQIPQNHFCWLPLLRNGSAAQARFFHARVLAGDRIGNAHSEDTRKRPYDHEHRLRRVDGGWRMSGRKFYSTGALFAQWIPFIGNDEAGRPHMFFAAAGSPGLQVIDDWSGMGQRTTASGTTVFEDVFVADAQVFPFVAEGAANKARMLLASLIHAAIDQGIAEEVLADARAWIREQNRPWIDNPHETHAEEPFVIQEFGRHAVQLRTAGLSLRHAADLVDAARAEPTEDSVLQARLAIADARLNCGNAATTLADRFFTLTGARATLERHGLDRHWRNARTHSLHDPLRWKLFHLGNYHLNGVVPGARTYI